MVTEMILSPPVTEPISGFLGQSFLGDSTAMVPVTCFSMEYLLAEAGVWAVGCGPDLKDTSWPWFTLTCFDLAVFQ